MSQVTTTGNVAISPSRTLGATIVLVLLTIALVALVILLRPAATVPAAQTSTVMQASNRDDYALRRPALVATGASSDRRDDYGLRRAAVVVAPTSGDRHDDYGLRHPTTAR